MRVVVGKLCEVQISRRWRGRGSLGVRGYEGEEDLERRISVWISTCRRTASTYVLCSIDVSGLQEDDGEHLPGLVLFCGRGILPGEYALCEFAGEGVVALDDEILGF